MSSRLRRRLLTLPLAAALPAAQGAVTPLTLRLPDPKAYSVATMAAGVPLGASTPFQVPVTKSG